MFFAELQKEWHDCHAETTLSLANELAQTIENFAQQVFSLWSTFDHQSQVKCGKYHEVPVHHKAEDFLDVYMEGVGIVGEKNASLFQSVGGKGRSLAGTAISRFDAWAVVKKRAKEAGITAEISPHSLQATETTAYLENGGTIEHAQQIAAHESPRTTKLYDRTKDQITLDEIERIAI